MEPGPQQFAELRCWSQIIRKGKVIRHATPCTRLHTVPGGFSLATNVECVQEGLGICGFRAGIVEGQSEINYESVNYGARRYREPCP